MWKWYLDEPGPVTLALCAGLTAVLAAAAVLLLRKPGKLKDRHDPADKETDDWLAGFANPGKDAFRTSAEPAVAASGADFLSGLGLEAGQQRAQPEPYEPATYTSPKETRPPNAEMKTTLLRPADATVFLGSAGKHVQSAVPALEYAKDGGRERVPITKSRFIIGRSESEADLVREETGISRIHAEIVKEAEGYSVRDLGSRNGTYVNGVLLAPYRMQLLQEGDIVKIITTEYTFKMGS
ncbi:FHA domain-containing protein [Paenibacillus sp. P26]|nr:FHA domain-containing protein [Paenibacillus sp. P26]